MRYVVPDTDSPRSVSSSSPKIRHVPARAVGIEFNNPTAALKPQTTVTALFIAKLFMPRSSPVAFDGAAAEMICADYDTTYSQLSIAGL